MSIQSVITLIPACVKLDDGQEYIVFVDLVNKTVKGDINDELKQEILNRFALNSTSSDKNVLKSLSSVQSTFADYHKEYKDIHKQYVKRAKNEPSD